MYVKNDGYVVIEKAVKLCMSDSRCGKLEDWHLKNQKMAEEAAISEGTDETPDKPLFIPLKSEVIQEYMKAHPEESLVMDAYGRVQDAPSSSSLGYPYPAQQRIREWDEARKPEK